jgi:dGTPase
MGHRSKEIKVRGSHGVQWEAVYRTRVQSTRGRIVSEPASATRTDFQRDRDRVIHATAFRRLKQKTQVFVAHEGDHYRTRLTHSLEVSQIARSLARTLGLDEDLAETAALSHDLGHPPFGHAGERALQRAMAPYGGFDHNAQSLRIVTALERRYAEFDGLNLTFETLEGILKHNGPVMPDGMDENRLPWALTTYTQWRGLEPSTYASLEAQCAAVADDIAYNNHDIDDGIKAGLFTIDDISELPMIGSLMREICAEHPRIDRHRLLHETIRRMIGLTVNDCLEESERRLRQTGPESVEDVRAAGRALVAFSEGFTERNQVVRDFLRDRMYRHHRVHRKMRRAERCVEELFKAFLDDPLLLPPEWSAHRFSGDGVQIARTICDYISGMTDGYLLEEHARVFGAPLSPHMK